MKLEDVAKALDVKLSTVKNKLYRTIERQKKNLSCDLRKGAFK